MVTSLKGFQVHRTLHETKTCSILSILYCYFSHSIDYFFNQRWIATKSSAQNRPGPSGSPHQTSACSKFFVKSECMAPAALTGRRTVSSARSAARSGELCAGPSWWSPRCMCLFCTAKSLMLLIQHKRNIKRIIPRTIPSPGRIHSHCCELEINSGMTSCLVEYLYL